LPHRFLAAFFAIAFRLAAESLAALAFPPFAPPSLPSATAAGFLPTFGSSSGFPSVCSPMAFTAKSWSLLERLGMIRSCHEISGGVTPCGNQTDPLPFEDVRLTRDSPACKLKVSRLVADQTRTNRAQLYKTSTERERVCGDHR